MRVLVIGGNGFIGTPVVRELLGDAHEVGVFHRSAGATSAAGAVSIRGDRNRLRDYEAELGQFAPQVIIDMILSSGAQAQELASIAAKLNARVVAISSMDVYRAWGVLLGTEAGDLEPLPIVEHSPVRTARRSYPPELVTVMKTIFTWLNPDYDKVAVEAAVMGGKIAATVVRLPMVYGPGDPLHRLYGMIKRISDARPAIILPDDFAAWRGPRGYVENVAHAIVLAATSERALGRTYHVCEEPSLPELDWEKRIATQTGWRGRFVVLPKEQTPTHLHMLGNAAQHVVADSGRIRRELEYEEPVRMEEAIRRTITWEEANPPSEPTFHKFDYAAEDAALAQAA